MLRKTLLLAIIILSFSALVSAKRVSLLASNCDPKEGCDINHLYLYNFDDGRYSGKELIVSTNTDNVRFDLENWFYQNRYLITSHGDIVDLKEKKVIHDSDGSIFAFRGNRIYIYVNNDDDRGLYFFDLVRRKYELARKFDENVAKGRLSPNGVRSADMSSGGLDIFEQGDGKRTIKGEFGSTFFTFDGELTSAPFVWLDDETIVTRTTAAEIVSFNVVNNKRTLLATIKGPEKCYSTLQIDHLKRLIYKCEDRYIIDVKKKTYTPLPSEPIGEFTATDKPDGFETFYYRGKEIGTFWSTDPFTASGNFVVFPYGEAKTNKAYPKGIKTWNAITSEWTTIDIDWHPEIITWIMEPGKETREPWGVR